MKVRESFVVDAPADQVFATLLDLERVAPCVPGADKVERLGADRYRGRIKVKVGPMTMQYVADIEIVDKDPDARRATVKVSAKEARGQGTAEALAGLGVVEAGGRTTGEIDVDVKLSGRVASMGQGAIQDVTSRLVGSFAENLGAMFGEPRPTAAGTEPAAAADPAPAAAEPISAGDVAGAVIRGRLREHGPLLVLVGAAALIGFVLGRRT